MNESSPLPPDLAQFTQNMLTVTEKSAEIMQHFLTRQAGGMMDASIDPFNVYDAFAAYYSQLLNDPTKLYEKQIELWQDYLEIWGHTASAMLGEHNEAPVQADKRDKRFRDPSWENNILFDYIKQTYLVTSRWMQENARDIQGLDAQTSRKVDFYTRQFVDALSPSNFLLTNPEVLRETMESGGENLVRGLQNMLEDIERGNGALQISMTDESAFEVGKNLATTSGKVIFRNELMELIQYAPMTEKVYKTPVLIIPAWINKFYIVDMQPDNSLVRWLTQQGHTVFVISWVNPDEKLSRKSFDDYMLSGPIAALDAIEQATGENQVNTVGYCLGGTLLAITLSYLHAKKQEKRIASATYLTTMIDFSDAGELAIFVDDEQLQALESRMERQGFMEGREMAMTFAMLRANDLIWSFVVNNYLLGRDPFPFDLLYWNADSTRMPATMHSFYLRNMYQNNLLKQPGALTINDVPVDLTKITTPSMIVSTMEDHIAPWKATYASTQIYSGEIEFILASSGHIAGVINPPERKKYAHWINNKLPQDPEEWLEGAKEQPGSWWTHWQKNFLTKGMKQDTPARKPGDGKLNPLCDAPGEYVEITN